MTTLELADELEIRNPRLRGKRTIHVPELAGFRLWFRRRYYALAAFFFAATIFHWLLANNWTGWPILKVAHGAFFGMSFVMMFFCEFRARQMTRQLQRRASEQLALDLMGRYSD